MIDYYSFFFFFFFLQKPSPGYYNWDSPGYCVLYICQHSIFHCRYIFVNIAYFTVMTPVELLQSSAVAVVSVYCSHSSHYHGKPGNIREF